MGLKQIRQSAVLYYNVSYWLNLKLGVKNLNLIWYPWSKSATFMPEISATAFGFLSRIEKRNSNRVFLLFFCFLLPDICSLQTKNKQTGKLHFHWELEKSRERDGKREIGDCAGKQHRLEPQQKHCQKKSLFFSLSDISLTFIFFSAVSFQA